MVAGDVEIMADAPSESLTPGDDLRHLMQQIVDVLQRFASSRVQTVSTVEARESMGLKFSSHLRFCFSVALSSRFLMGLLFKSTEVVYGVTGTDVTELPEYGVSP